MKKYDVAISKSFINQLKDYSVRINRSTMNIEKLRVLVMNGLNIENLRKIINQYYNELDEARKLFKNKKQEELKAIRDDAILIESLAFKQLNFIYRAFSDYNKKSKISEELVEFNKTYEMSEEFSNYYKEQMMINDKFMDKNEGTVNVE